MRDAFKAVKLAAKTPDANLWVFTTSTLWLLATAQFNSVRANPGNDFCLILTEEENTRYGEYYKKLFCVAFKRFDAHKKMTPKQLQLLKIDSAIPRTYLHAKFEIGIENNVDDFLLQKKQTHAIHWVSNEDSYSVLALANTKTQEGYSCRIVTPKSKRGRFNAKHLSEMHEIIIRKQNLRELGTLIVAMDLDDTTIKIEEMQHWCLGMNFYNPEALRHISQIYLQYKDLLEIKLLAITARNPEAEKKAPIYFQADHLFIEFLQLTGVPFDLCREGQHIFYTSPVVSAKYNQLLELYEKQRRTCVVLFDNLSENWSPKNPHSHFHLVEIENAHEDDLKLGIPQIKPVRSTIAERPPTPMLYPQNFDDPRSESTRSSELSHVSIQHSVNQFPVGVPQKEKSLESQSCCCVSFFGILRKKIFVHASQPLAQTEYRSYNTQGK